MRTFVLLLEKSLPKEINLNNLSENRIDLVCRVITSAFYLDNNFRRDVRLIVKADNVVLEFDGSRLRGIRPDERTNAGILRKVLSTGSQPGVRVLPGYAIPENAFWLDQRGKDYRETRVSEDPVFVVGGEKGMRVPENAIRISLGKRSYLASQCVTIINHWMDVSEWSTRE